MTVMRRYECPECGQPAKAVHARGCSIGVAPGGRKLVREKESIVVEYVRAADHRGAVDLLDELADALARVTGPEPPDESEIAALLQRAAIHANGGR